MPESDPSKMDFGGSKAWRDIWGSGRGVGVVHAVVPAAERMEQYRREYLAAKGALTTTVRPAPEPLP